MSIRLRDVLMGKLDALRHEPTDKRIRGVLQGETVIDSTRALLVWEPGRVVPGYAVPVEDVAGELVADGPAAGPAEAPIDAPVLDGRRVLDPSVAFSMHTSAGEPVRIRSRATGAQAAAFRPHDPDLAGYVLADFAAFDAWYEEDEPNVAHPRDPFHRIDIVHGSRHVRVEHDGRTLAESSRPFLLFEPPLPVRYYLPRDDVRTELLRPSATVSHCAYKGRATYWALPDGRDVAWSYPEPLREAAEIAGRVAFFNELADLVVDGEPLARPVTPWSRR